MDLIFKGIITGLILSIMVGPVFFVLLETSIRKGIKAAVFFDLGVLFNDILYILIAYFFYQQVSTIMEHEDTSFLQGVGGGAFCSLRSLLSRLEKSGCARSRHLIWREAEH